ncbi:hypothetical protein [Polyangium sp. 6x1]|uniref:hypothetical protein n=1 Tax=Polyangium sp. 6x1 TaxID=3042689 RepID=UPI0024829DC1|nr:hypothetical protein [Polyangium sp. 6x1]MDI1444807.1 hypothetical protein [Polyangium sp. 6x1]
MTKPAPDAPSPDDENVYAPPVAPAAQPAAGRSAARATLGQRLAGACLIVSAALWLLESLLGGRGLFAGPFTTPLMRAFPVLLDVSLGGALVLGLRRVAWLAGARVVLVLASWTFVLVVRDRMTAVPGIVLGIAYLLLLVRDAGKPRMVVGSVFWALCMLLDVIGLRAAVTGRNPIAAFVQIRAGEIEPEPVTVVTGEQSHYRLRLPSGDWFLHTRASTQQEGPRADRFLSRPDVDAHLLVLVEKVPGTLLAPNGLVQEVGQMERRDAASELVRSKAMRAHPEEGVLLWVRKTKAGVETARLIAVVATYEWSFKLIATAPSRIFPEIEAELEGILESFELPTDEKHGLPPEVEPQPVDVVEGVAAKYRLKAPGARWFLRKDEAVKKDSSLADRWLVRPDKDAHVLVIIEDLQGKDVDVDAYTDAAVELIEKELKGTVKSRMPVLTHPENGRVLRVSREEQGEHEIESYYGLFTQAGRGFTVIASATSERFPSAAPDLVRLIESFELPREGMVETR